MRSTSPSHSSNNRDPFGIGLSVLAFMVPFLAVFASKALVVALAAFALSGLASWLIEGRKPQMAAGFLILLGLLMLLGGASVFWARSADEALSQLARFVGIFSAGYLAIGAIANGPPQRRNRILFAFAIGHGLAMALLLFELLTEGAITAFFWRPVRIFDFSTGAAAMALFAWPAALMLGRHTGRVAIGLFVIVVMTTIGFKSASLATGFAMGCGIVSAVGVSIFRRSAVRILAAVLCAAILTSPLIANALPRPHEKVAADTWIPSGVFPRLMIWSYVTDRISERPLLGWGLNSSRTFSSKNDMVYTGGPWPLFVEPLPLHPHNAALQWWLELGFLGAALGAATVVWLIRRAGEPSAGPANAPIGVGVVITALVIAGLSFGIWQSWWLATFWITAAFVVAGRQPDSPSPAHS